jgi:tetratricopeptide (TPR) repeat protein
MWRSEGPARRLDLAEALNNFAGVLRAQKRLPEAETALRESLGLRRTLLSADHPLVAQSISNLAVMIAAQGNLEAAEPLFAEALDLETRRLGPDHPDRAFALTSLATVRRHRGDAAGAERHLREAIRVRQGAMPAADARVLSARSSLVEVLVDQNRIEEARAEVDRAVADAESGDAEPGARKLLYAQAAQVYKKLGDAGKAGEFSAKAGRP